MMPLRAIHEQLIVHHICGQRLVRVDCYDAATGRDMTCILYTTHDTALSELAIALTAGDAMAEMKPEQSGDGRRSQIYLLRLWREATEAPWRLSLREASEGEPIGFADLDDLVIF